MVLYFTLSDDDFVSLENFIIRIVLKHILFFSSVSRPINSGESIFTLIVIILVNTAHVSFEISHRIFRLLVIQPILLYEL